MAKRSLRLRKKCDLKNIYYIRNLINPITFYSLILFIGRCILEKNKLRSQLNSGIIGLRNIPTSYKSNETNNRHYFNFYPTRFTSILNREFLDRIEGISRKLFDLLRELGSVFISDYQPMICNTSRHILYVHNQMPIYYQSSKGGL